MSAASAREGSAAGHGSRLVAQRCTGCGFVLFPAGDCCPSCGSGAVEPQPLSDHGEVFSWTVIHRAAAGWKAPYVVALVDFPEGPRVFAQMQADPAAMHHGLPVHLAFGTPPAGRPEDSYYFVPANS